MRKVKLRYSVQKRPLGKQNLFVCCCFSSSFFMGSKVLSPLGSTCHQFTHPHTISLTCWHTSCTCSAPFLCHVKSPSLQVQPPDGGCKPSQATFPSLINITFLIQTLRPHCSDSRWGKRTRTTSLAPLCSRKALGGSEAVEYWGNQPLETCSHFEN